MLESKHLQDIRVIVTAKLSASEKLRQIRDILGLPRRGPYNVAGISRDFPAYMRQRYTDRRKAGLCPQCGKKSDQPERSMCSKCYAKHKAKYQRKKI